MVENQLQLADGKILQFLGIILIPGSSTTYLVKISGQKGQGESDGCLFELCFDQECSSWSWLIGKCWNERKGW